MLIIYYNEKDSSRQLDFFGPYFNISNTDFTVNTVINKF